MIVSPKTLKLLAFITWITGGVVLFFKGYSLFAEAAGLRPGAEVNSLPFFIALPVGGLKARYLFLHACLKNLARIDALENPRLWQFFRVGFFIFLFSMVTLGAWLSGWAAGNYGKLIVVASMDLTLSVALMGSLGGFREKETFRTGD